jgi:hypothetical protein
MSRSSFPFLGFPLFTNENNESSSSESNSHLVRSLPRKHQSKIQKKEGYHFISNSIKLDPRDVRIRIPL